MGEDSTNLVIDDSGEKIKVTLGNLGLDYGENKIYLKAKFCDFSTPMITSDTIIINHPEPAVEEVGFIEIDPNTIIPGTPIELFNDSIYFRADVTYNDFLSIDEDICLEVYRIFEGGDPILEGE